MKTPKIERELAEYGVAVLSINVARDGFGKAPSVKTCNEGEWRKAIDQSGKKHETYVLVDDRDHEKGNLYDFVTAPLNGATPAFPVAFVLDHNGRVVNKKFSQPELSKLIEAAKEQSEIYDKALKKALAAKDGDKDDSKDDSKDEENKSDKDKDSEKDSE